MAPIAYGLRAPYDAVIEQDGESVPVFMGGLVALGEGRELDTAKVLDGPIVIEDTDYQAVNALDAFVAFKRVPAPKVNPERAAAYDGVSIPDLKVALRNRDLSVTGKRDVLVERLIAHDDAVASGDVAGAKDPTPEVEPEADVEPDTSPEPEVPTVPADSDPEA
jgi:hypothetical protein